MHQFWPLIVAGLALCGSLLLVMLIVRVLGRPAIQFASDLWDWAAEQGALGKLIYVGAWILIFPAMLVFCICGGLVVVISERRSRAQKI